MQSALAPGKQASHVSGMSKIVTQARIGEILKPAGVEEDARREDKVRRNFWRTARRAARHIPFMDEVAAGYFAKMDRDTPLRVRGTLLAALAYFVMPVDMIPDFVVGFGFTDDLAVLTAAMAAIRGHIKPAHREAARRALDENAR